MGKDGIGRTITQMKIRGVVCSGRYAYVTATATEHPADAAIMGPRTMGIAQFLRYMSQARCVKKVEQGKRENELMA